VKRIAVLKAPELFKLPQTCEGAAKTEVAREFRIVPAKKESLISTF
jgi:hypothetical protein